ncbi:MAG: RluA family pseudouridine synthase [Clostridia bacterium]|nr:RluA family pseudouridine synthase [Clostridia bacterium]
MKTLVIKENDAGRRLDKFLAAALPLLPKSMMYKYIRLKKIKVNRKRAEIGQILELGDTVELFIKEEFMEKEPPRDFFKNIRAAFGVIYEDENLILCDKPAGLLCHSDEEGEQNTLIEQVKAYLWQKGEYVPEEENSFAPALCNRIDRNTAGIVIAAKNAPTLRVMNEKIKKRSVAKYYLLAVHGNMEKKTGELTGYIWKDAKNNKVTVYEHEPKGKRDAKYIVTRYRVVGKHEQGDVLEAELVTGRMHQIRAHFASVGHPLVGDGKYAVNRDDRKMGFTSQELYSYKLEFLADEPSHLDYLEGKTFTRDISDFPFEVRG